MWARLLLVTFIVPPALALALAQVLPVGLAAMVYVHLSPCREQEVPAFNMKEPILMKKNNCLSRNRHRLANDRSV
jgi:hypothetical protein